MRIRFVMLLVFVAGCGGAPPEAPAALPPTVAPTHAPLGARRHPDEAPNPEEDRTAATPLRRLGPSSCSCTHPP